MFQHGKDPAHASLRRLVQRLEKARIDHAIMGGMAVYVHGHQRLTNDVDVLLTPEGLEEFCRRFVPKQYQPVEGRPRRFVDKVNQITLDVLVAGRYPGSGKPGPVAFPDPASVREQINKVYYVNLDTLIQLKLAARRHQDFADVVELIRIHGLDESFQNRLHASLRRDFLECLDEKRREDDYLAKNG